MSGFIRAPQFLPGEPPLQNGTNGQVLTIVAGKRAWAAGGGGGGTTGYLGTYVTTAPTAGVHNDFAIAGFGAGVGRADIDTTAGDVELTGLAAGTDGQLLNVRNIGANNLILDPLNAGSAGANQFQLPGQLYVAPQYEAILLCYYGGAINKWCMA